MREWSLSSQVAEAVLGSKGPWPPGLVDSFQSYQTSLSEVLVAGVGHGQGAVPLPSGWLLHSLSSSPSAPHHSPGRKSGQESSLLSPASKLRPREGLPAPSGHTAN